MKYTDYKFDYMIDHLLDVAQQELQEYLVSHSPKDFADLTWFENQYGHELLEREVMKKWFCVPSVRAGKSTEWATTLPKLAALAKELPGIVNFSLNAIEPGGGVPTHSDYSYDMRMDLSNVDQVYVILVAVDIPEASISDCGFHIGEEQLHLKTGDIIAFDGGIPHGGWNYTDKWRYTLNIDIKAEYWNV